MFSSTPITWVEINLSAIISNIQHIQRAANVPIMAVVKANAYGHGIVEVSRAAVEAGVKWLGVARLDEALFLREKGIQANILVLGHTPPEDTIFAVEKNISLSLHDFSTLEIYKNIAAATRKKLRVHVKIDTGMGRLGVPVEKGLDFFLTLLEISSFSVEGIFTHMARADEPSLVTTAQQRLRFEKILSELSRIDKLPEWVHAANSASALFHKDLFYTLVRPGISIYGLNPSSDSPLPDGFIPALSWKAILTEVKRFPAFRGISYGHRYVTNQPEVLGTIPVGYGDGFRRIPGNHVLVRGKKVPVVGNVCMDQCVISLQEVPEAEVGDEVVLIGEQEGDKISVDEVANVWGTISYEPVCALAGRLPRKYIHR